VLLGDGLFLLGADASISLREVLDVGGRLRAVMRAREPASSMTSMALSGRKRPVM
jgi:hypothetical protein